MLVKALTLLQPPTINTKINKDISKDINEEPHSAHNVLRNSNLLVKFVDIVHTIK